MPARSKGCRNCVQRKIRCDLTQPICQRCQKARLDCDGPQQLRTFITETPETASVKFAPRRRNKCYQQSPGAGYDSLGFENILESHATPSPYSDDAYCIFYFDNMFSFGSWNDDLQHNKSWIYNTLRTPSKHPVSNIALQCLIQGAFGRFHGDKRLQTSSFRLYGEGLKALTLHLQSSATAHTFDVLCAVVFLQYFEFIFFTERNGWIQHSRALKHLVEQKGPEWFTERPARSLFVYVRRSIYLEALASCERSFLERPEWQKILSSQDEDLALTYTLTDIATAIPGLFEDVIKLVSAESITNIQAKATALHVAFRTIFNRLQAWWLSWRSDESRLPRRTSTPVRLGIDLSPSATHFLRFANLEVCACWCHFHAYMLLTLHGLDETNMLSSGGRELAKRIPHPEQNRPMAMAISDHQRVSGIQRRKHARAIMEALPFYCLPQYAVISGTYVGFPARTAWEALLAQTTDKEICKKEARWIERLADFVSDKSGFELARKNITDVDVYVP